MCLVSTIAYRRVGQDHGYRVADVWYRHGKQRGLYRSTPDTTCPINVGGICRRAFRGNIISSARSFPAGRSLAIDPRRQPQRNVLPFSHPPPQQTTTTCNSRFRCIYYYTMYLYCSVYSNFINMHPVDYAGCFLLAYSFFLAIVLSTFCTVCTQGSDRSTPEFSFSRRPGSEFFVCTAV